MADSIRWFSTTCPDCGHYSAVGRLPDEQISYRCPSCSRTITSGPPLPDPLTTTRQQLLRAFQAPDAQRPASVDEIAQDLAAAFDGVVVEVTDIAETAAAVEPERWSIAEWMSTGWQPPVSPSAIAALYRRLFDREPPRRRQTCLYSRDELLMILNAARTVKSE